MSDAQDKIEQINNPFINFLDYHIYLISLLGFMLFYGLESVAKISKEKNLKLHNKNFAESKVFYLHIISFAAYNLLIGYFILHREVPGLVSLLFYFVAMATHITVNDYSLRQHFKEDYQKTGRWILSAAVIIGWLFAVFFDLPDITLDMLFAFLAGGMILNIIKEELPEERQSKFTGFMMGCLVYTILLLLME